MSEAPPPMPDHLAAPARPDRARRAGYLAIAMGVGLLAFAFVDGDQRGGRDRGPARVATSSPSTSATVLGVTVTAADVPRAGAAAPVTFTLDDEPAPVATTTPPRRPAPTTTTTTEGVDIHVPTSIVNTSTTTTETSTTTGSTTSTSTTAGHTPTVP